MSRWNVTPLLDNGLGDLLGVGPLPGADLLGDINALLSGLQRRNKLGDVTARSLGLQRTGLLGNLLDDGLLLVETFLGSRLQNTAGGSAKLSGDLLTVGLGGVLLNTLGVLTALIPGPFGTFLLGGVALSLVDTFFFLDDLASDDVIFNVMFVVAGLTLGLVDGLTFDGTFTITDQGSVAEPDGLFEGNLLVLDEAVLLEVLVALLLLLGLEVGGVGGVAPLGVAMVALDLLVVFGLFDHHNLVDTSLTGGSNGADVKGGIIALSLARVTVASRSNGLLMMSMIVIVIVIVMGTSIGSAELLIEGEAVQERLGFALTIGSRSGHNDQKTKLGNSIHD